MSYLIDYSDNESNSDNSDNSSNEELFKSKDRPLTPALLKTHERRFEHDMTITQSENTEEFKAVYDDNESNEKSNTHDENYLKNVQNQLNNAVLQDLKNNIELLKNMHEDICERLDWVTQQTQMITDNFNEDRKQMTKERRKDRIQDLFFSFMELIFFVIGIVYATILFILEVYYSVNFNIF